MHPLILAVGYILITLAPLALAFAQGKPPRGFLDEVSSGLALTGFAILLVEFVLSGRLRAISGRIGMDITMRLHQLAARTATLFILVHPFLYRSVYFGHPRPWDVTGQLTLGLTSVSLWTGIAAWVLLMVLVLTAIFRDQLPQSYEIWRVSHGVGALVVALLAALHTLDAGRYSADPVLAGLWLVMLGLAVASLVYVYALKPISQLRDPWKVTSVRRVALKTWELVISPARADALPFRAGQFVWLNVGHSPFSVRENPFSISSSPAERPQVSFLIKEVGDMTRSLGTVAAGTPAYVDGPHGNLVLQGNDAPGIALIAGGVGVAPLLSILRQLRHDGDKRPVKLLYGNRCVEQIAYGEELDAMRGALDLDVVHVLSEPPPDWTGPVGYLDAALVTDIFSFDGAKEWVYFVCGPAPMIEAVETALLDHGVPAHGIVSEKFTYD